MSGYKAQVRHAGKTGRDMEIAAAAAPQGVHVTVAHQPRGDEGDVGHAKLDRQERCAGEEGDAHYDVGLVSLQHVSRLPNCFYKRLCLASVAFSI